MNKAIPKDLSKIQHKDNVRMTAKISNQINTNQQSNMALSAYSVTTQSCSTVNINFG
ncbi:hypothetical protein [Clostridium formicaceticum]|uniref:Uncharacterized protein n=1 Tax=Clostridium formicaceticum TaxID=1497 RepID=A0AAC9WGP1_9CLOT|nr:hypothetical protein [Clostridium formicaceticum]ARE88019.1 hypothetical protein CLFO_24200 [Clostridium formicaceticum]